MTPPADGGLAAFYVMMGLLQPALAFGGAALLIIHKHFLRELGLDEAGDAAAPDAVAIVPLEGGGAAGTAAWRF
jgi:hypothetical protein